MRHYKMCSCFIDDDTDGINQTFIMVEENANKFLLNSDYIYSATANPNTVMLFILI